MYNDKGEKKSIKLQLKNPGPSNIPLAGKKVAWNSLQGGLEGSIHRPGVSRSDGVEGEETITCRLAALFCPDGVRRRILSPAKC